MKKIILEALKVARNKPVLAKTVSILPNLKTTMNRMADIRKKALGGIPLVTLNLDEIKMTIAEVETNMYEAIGQMSVATDPVESARLQQRVIQLKIQLEKLYAEMTVMQVKFGLANYKIKL